MEGDTSLGAQLLADVDRGTQRLQEIVSDADGLQASGDRLQASRHFSNTLCNVMRGGIFENGYQISGEDLLRFVRAANRPVAQRHAEFLSSLPTEFEHLAGLALFKNYDDADLLRLYFEYLPLTFSRRHGDPSRPWNQFSIDTQRPDCSRILNYQGNWRDIFQNWEALGLSYPEFLESFVFKFVNASTVDGYNPYRITRDGIDWEVHDPSDPWSNIGYWGDHQIVYLLKLIEHSEAYHPGRLGEYLDDDIFVYAHVPYQIKSLDDLFKNPRDSIEFDHVAHDLLMKRTQQIGSDGKLLHHDDSHPIRVNLAEKLLVPVLAKMANFIPDAGIWMNTQRPEWNDANNALVGYGVSMVTLYYLRRYLDFCGRLFAQCQVTQYEVSAEICMLLRSSEAVLMEHHQKMAGGFDSRERRQFVNEIGAAGSCYRELIYDDGLSGEKVSLSVESITRS